MVFFPRRLCNVPYNTVENLYNHTMERECSWGFNLDSVPLTCVLYDQKILPFWMILHRDLIRVSQIPSAMEGFLINEQSQHWWLACTSGVPMLFVSVTWYTPSLSGLPLLTFSCTFWKPSLFRTHEAVSLCQIRRLAHMPSCRVKEVKSTLSDQNQPPGGAQESPSPSPASSSRHRGWPLISNQEEHWFSENVRPCNHSPVAAWACLVWRLLH